MARPLQLQGGKLPPAPRAVSATGSVGGRGAREARYVHKIGTSPKPLEFKGTSAEGREIARRKRRDEVTRQVVSSLQRCGREKQAKALAECGRWFDVWYKPGVGAKIVGCPCDSMFCPECANRRSLPLQKKLLKMVNRPGRSYWFLTLTIPNQPDLTRWDIAWISERFAELRESWAFTEIEMPDGKRDEISGGVRSIECTYNGETQSWHPHIHALIEAPKVLPRYWLAWVKFKWFLITGGALYVHLERVYGRTKRGTKMHGRMNMRALREVCKYVTKCSEFAGDHLLVSEFLDAFKGVRRIQCFGSFHGAAAHEFDRMPGEDERGISEVELSLRDEGYVKLPVRAHITDTVVLPDGTRQLTFAFAEYVREYVECHDPPFELEFCVPAPQEQKRIEFAGATPAESVRQASLFESVA